MCEIALTILGVYAILCFLLLIGVGLSLLFMAIGNAANHFSTWVDHLCSPNLDSIAVKKKPTASL